MRNQLASIELRTLVGELKQLEDSWVGQVYDLQAATVKPSKALVFQLGSEGTKRFLVCLAPSAVFYSKAKPTTSEKPGGFCSMLRQHLDNAKLVSVSQLGSERIVELVFSSGKQQRLIIELFSKGNVILVGEKGVILAAAEHQAWKDRTIRPGFTYSPPPATANFVGMPFGQFSKALLSSEKDSVVKALAVDLGLSGSYAEELCSAAGVDKARAPSSLSQQELDRLFSSLQQLLSRKPSPIAVLDDSGSVVEVFPFPTAATVAAARTKPFPSFNEAVEALLLRQLESSFSASKESSSLRRIKELEIAIGQQKATITEMERVVAEATAAAEAVYTHYQDVKRILDDYNALRKTFTPEQLREYFKPNKLVKSIDEKTGTITLEIEDGSGVNQ